QRLLLCMLLLPPLSTPFPYTTLFRSNAPLAHTVDDHFAANLLASGFQTQAVTLQRVAELLQRHVVALGNSGQGLVELFVGNADRSEEHTSELQSRENLVCRLLLEKKK